MRLKPDVFRASHRHVNRNPLCLFVLLIQLWTRRLNISSKFNQRTLFSLPHSRRSFPIWKYRKMYNLFHCERFNAKKSFLEAKKPSWHGEESASAGDLRQAYSTRPALCLISRQKLSKLNDWFDNKLNKKFIITNKRMEKEKNLQSLQLCSANDHTLFRGFGATVKHNSAAQTCGIFKWNLWEFWDSCAAGKISPVFLQNFFNFLRFLLPGTMDLIKPNNTREIKNLTPSRLILPSFLSLQPWMWLAVCTWLCKIFYYI